MDTHFKHFCDNLEVVLSEHEKTIDPEQDLLVRQRDQIRNLIKLEARFRDQLIAHAWGPGVYKDFVKFIVLECKNVLAARPYFRERHAVFSASISKALKKRLEKPLYKFKINWSFVEWVMKSRKWRRGSPVYQTALEIARARKELLEQNLPLAISQAGIFYRSTPRSHLSWMDIVQIQCQGLLLAIDKFVPPDDRRMSEKASLARYRIFRAVAIGIMRRDRVNAYSETLIHFYPQDRLKIYQANKILRRTPEGGIDFNEIAEKINQNLGDIKTDAEDIQGLLSAASVISSDYQSTVEDNSENQESAVLGIDSVLDSEQDDPESQIEKKQAVREMYRSISKLSLFEKKLLKLKGLDIKI